MQEYQTSANALVYQTLKRRAVLSLWADTMEAIVGHVDKETTKLYTHLRASDLVTAVRDSTAKKRLVTNLQHEKTVRFQKPSKSSENAEKASKRMFLGFIRGTPEGIRYIK